jgi:hypothetical protein
MMNPNEDRLARIEQRLARLEALAGVILQHIGLPPERASQMVEAQLRRQSQGYNLMDEVKALLRAGQKTQAMMLYGERTGADFKTTKAAIEALEKQL